MKRTITFAAFAVAAFTTGIAGTAFAQAHAAKKADCILPNGDSGYMVSTGDAPPVCTPVSGS